MNKTRIIAAYLPQYHVVEENSRWWGEGYTDWVAVKKAKKQFTGHNQPRIPLDENYYSLDDYLSIKWQADMAKKYGIYGFGIYHYWFSTEQKLLTKPAELLLAHDEIDINYCFIWDNHSWVNKTWKNIGFTNQWAPQFEGENSKDGILAELKYGTKNDWKIHYEYLKGFFIDNRYIKIDNKPVFGIFAPNNDNETLHKMCSFIDECAVKDGFNGVYFISAATFSRKKIQYTFRYEPFNICSPIDYIGKKIKNKKNLKVYDYDKVWKKILFNARFIKEKDVMYGGFVRYDDTPRRGNNANVIIGDTPEKFYKYMKKLIYLSNTQKKPFIYLTAWNEWGEGAYLEPDSETGYLYLEALKRAIDEN